MVRALFFDVTDTLQNFTWTKQWTLLSPVFYRELGVTRDHVKEKYQQVYELYRLGIIKNDMQWIDILIRQLGKVATKAKMVRLVNKHKRVRKHITSLPQFYVDTLEELREYFTLAVVSSGIATWCYEDFKRIFKINFTKHFDLVVFSQEYGYLKESGRLFDIAFKKLKFKASEVAYVGNDYAKDILYPKSLGMRTVFLNHHNAPHGKADVVIKRLSSLRKKMSTLQLL